MVVFCEQERTLILRALRPAVNSGSERCYAGTFTAALIAIETTTSSARRILMLRYNVAIALQSSASPLVLLCFDKHLITPCQSTRCALYVHPAVDADAYLSQAIATEW